jgi:hypothetical protein
MQKELNDIYISRMTHIENIPHVLQHGITHRASPYTNQTYKEIGDVSLIATRSTKQVYVDNNKPQDDGQWIKLDDYIPFYFGIRMPMLYVMQHGGNYTPKTPASDIIYMVCHLLSVVEQQAVYYYTDGHPVDRFTSFFDHSTLNDLPTNIDWEAVVASFWNGEENLPVRRKKQAELLVKEDIPSTLIHAFMCYDEKSQERLHDMGIAYDRIKVYPKAYF